ncbi:alpha/beta hydrolase [Labrys monachus]|uniref:Esterase/lipase superfamily enzyme n=1 Tax=Labrys monachus TaxID=217067 RepID=A0ABU0FKD2_9HYPH|nr:alpha/beta hydrolase [Labrys monachus]MDQ0394574.1 esterase/lipase superfamily enzyme [Labrys monachus]
MRAASLFALVLSALALTGCVGIDDDTGATDAPLKPVLTTAAAPDRAAATTPLGIWRGGITMLMMTTRKSTGDAEPWFDTGRASEPTAARLVLYPPSNTLLASVNPIASSDWSVAGVSKLGGDQPATALATQAEGRDVLVYVHGYNETFDSAATSYAKLVAGIKFSGVPILFAWPSRAAFLDYMTDRDSALWSRDALEDTLTALAKDPKVGRINILAHSMGGMVALEALRSLSDRSDGTLSGRFGAIILANPDVDVDLFKRQIKRLPLLSSKMTVIVSANDRALELSTKLAGGVPRVGLSDRAELDQTGVKVVDATDYTSGIINHDIFMSRVELRAVIARALDNADD